MKEQTNMRVVVTITTKKSIEEINYLINYFFRAKKYKLVNYNGEYCFMYYNQLLDTASFPTYMKVKVDNELITLIAFVSKSGKKEEVFQEENILVEPRKTANYRPTRVLLTDFVDFIEALRDESSVIKIEKKLSDDINVDFNNNLYKSTIPITGSAKNNIMKNSFIALLFIGIIAIIYILFFYKG